MNRQRFAAEPMLRLVPAAAPLDHVRAVCRPHTSAEPTWARGRRPCGGLDVSAAQRLRPQEREHAAWPRRGGALPLDHRLLQAG